ncbi:MAG TPA: DNA polymerase III subunit gamma/tau, partial [Paracoccaceae bacterium]|nr:DNA polymerase III subunit gamma/tau [Paracoccaceae bacterium]
LIREARDIKLLAEVEEYVSLVRYRPGLIEFNPAPGAPGDLAGRLGQTLRALTDARWGVSVSDGEGAPTVAGERRRAADDMRAKAEDHPLVAAALASFPGARVSVVRRLSAEPPQADILAPAPEPDDMEGDLVDDTDPFEEEF